MLWVAALEATENVASSITTGRGSSLATPLKYSESIALAADQPPRQSLYRDGGAFYPSGVNFGLL